MTRWLRWSHLLSALGALAMAIYVYSISPSRVPVHYGPSGVPDRWGSPTELLIVYGCTVGLTTLLFAGLPQLFRLLPPSMVNLPHKDYWLSPENRDRATEKFGSWAQSYGTAMNVFFFILQWALAPRGTGNTGAPYLPFLVGGFVLFSLSSAVWFARSYRLPKAA